MKTYFKKQLALFILTTLVLLNLNLVSFAQEAETDASSTASSAIINEALAGGETITNENETTEETGEPSPEAETETQENETNSELEKTPIQESFESSEYACIPKDLINGNYIYTIVEEPLGFQTPLTHDQIKSKIKNNETFFTTYCWRNYLVIKDDETEPKPITAVLNKCLAKELGEEKKAEGKEVIYTCQAVQAYISKGGTSMIEGYIKTIYTFAASIIGLIAVAVLIISGMQISLSTGDSDAVSSAKSRIIKSLAGLAILFLSGLILNTINPNFFTAGEKEIQTQTQDENKTTTNNNQDSTLLNERLAQLEKDYETLNEEVIKGFDQQIFIANEIEKDTDKANKLERQKQEELNYNETLKQKERKEIINDFNN